MSDNKYSLFWDGTKEPTQVTWGKACAEKMAEIAVGEGSAKVVVVTNVKSGYSSRIWWDNGLKKMVIAG